MKSKTRIDRNVRLKGFVTCTGCGTCQSMCPSHAIDMRVDQRKGVYVPIVDNNRCVDCGTCSEVCPAVSMDARSMKRPELGLTSKDVVLGDFEKCYVAHATNHNIRCDSSSGGLVTALLMLALDEGLIDGALVTRMSPRDPLIPEPFIARTRDEILSASRSKYCPVPANQAIRALKENEGRFAVVGLPCHLHGIREAEKTSGILKRRITLHLGLFCSHSLSFHATSHLLKRVGIPPEDVAKIDYRGRGWPGGMTIARKDGTGHFISNQSLLWRVIFGSHFFTPTSCLWCTDLTSELSDLSFGDAWIPRIMKTESIGKSVVVSRTPEGENLLRIARDKNVVELEQISPHEVIASQMTFSYFKKENVKLRKWLGEPFQVHPEVAIKERLSIISELIALTAILNANLGHNYIFRRILLRIPVGAMHLYLSVFDAAMGRARDRWFG